MTNEQARAILRGMMARDEHAQFDPAMVDGSFHGGWMQLRPDGCTLDGDFTREQLQAIVAYLRDPAGVCSAAE